MQLLLFLSEPADRMACEDYLALHGCAIDSAADAETARAMARFRRYDSIVTDLDSGMADDLVRLARKRSVSVVPVVLATDDSPGTFTKPVRLERILEEVRRPVQDRSALDQSN